MNEWNIGAGYDLVEGEWLEDRREILKVWFVEATNARGDRYYWRGIIDEAHALRVELVGQMEVKQNRFDIRRGQWELSENPVYGSAAYVADWQNQEYSRMDDEERSNYRW